MMDYCARESTINESMTLCEKQMSASEILKEARKELAETIGILTKIRGGLDGFCPPEKNAEEPRCFCDEVKGIERMAIDCMGLSHAISDSLFGGVL